MSPWLWVLLLPAGALIFLLISKLASTFDQWSELSSAYAATGSLPVRMLRWQSALLNGARYRTCLLVGWDDRGMFMVPEKVFRYQRPPVLFPWADLCVRKADYWTWYPYELHLKKLPDLDLRVRARLAGRLVKAAESANQALHETGDKQGRPLWGPNGGGASS